MNKLSWVKRSPSKKELIQNIPIKQLTDVDGSSFMLYNNNCEKNILILGSCRLTQLCFYFNNLNLNRNIYFIYIVHVVLKHGNSIPDSLKENLRNIMKNTDIIVCETIKNHGEWNTSLKSDITFFKTLDIETTTKIYRIPNLELRMYHYELINTFKIPEEEVFSYFENSKKHLFEHLNETGYSEVAEFINKNIKKYKLFYTYNHPSSILSLCLFNYLCLKMGISIDIPFLNQMKDYNFLAGNDRPIFQRDIDMYKLEFATPITPDSYLHTPDIFRTFSLKCPYVFTANSFDFTDTLS
jgi:hypothetical protein